MSTFAARTMHTMAFPHALGTGLLVQPPLDPDEPTGGDTLGIRHAIDRFIDGYERALSRFRDDSTVSAMRGAAHGGSFDFPDWAGPLFDLYDALVDATDGAIDPCVGEDLIRLGYDARYSFHISPDAFRSMDDELRDSVPANPGTVIPADAVNAATGRPSPRISSENGISSMTTGWNLGAIHGRATWRDDVERRGSNGTTLAVRRPIALDFGACGKGYLVDLLARRFLMPTAAGAPYVIDAGGDLLIHSPSKPLTIAMEDPMNTDNAVGTVEVGAGAFCASAPSRRHWEVAGHRLHHLLNAIDGLPVNDVAATWVHVPAATGTGTGTGTDTGSATDIDIGTGIGIGIVTGTGTGTEQSPGRPLAAYPTALADGLATALFTTPATQLHERLGPDVPFQCAILNADRTAAKTRAFPGNFFVG
ncbi:FAD:protein FMN transferase [Bifidobacterium sp. MA2]|uniref:FAD:protein FMN transferase n=1 Tax=Bifidobacterium santillanense TaxID=2809028 RepID=A0ABS5UQX8_9BIFI|nr:FAD:protein FMN transferase [Bifidobacterium santillanense]MBT1173347.1 FAD:protein FMN transferase [Bifidobacterium santillanense]